MAIRVLVVDDDALSREVFTLLLQSAGYEVETAESGDAALLHLQASHPHPQVVLTDLQMPGTSGRELAGLLRTICGQGTMLVAMSATEPENGAGEGFDAFLLKPFTVEAFQATVSGGTRDSTPKADDIDAVVLDATIYKKLAASMQASKLEQLFSLCLSDAESRLKKMKKAASEGDAASYIREAHAVKGSCGMVGALQLQTLATSMETTGLSDDHVASLNEFVVACERLRRMLSQIGSFTNGPAESLRRRRLMKEANKKSDDVGVAGTPIRIVVADDHPVVRFGVKNMLESEPGFEVVGEAEDGDVAITQTLELEPDILLLDLAMPRLPGLEALRAIMNKSPRVKIIMLTSTISTQQIIEALQIGARGIVLKDAVAGDLSRSLRAVLSGDYWIGGERVANLVTALNALMKEAAAVPERKTYGLTPRELEVVTCIVEGCSNKDVAKQFTISEETVKRHLSNIFDKTGVSTRLELALFAIAHKLVTLEN